MRASIFIAPFMAAAVAVAQSEVVETLVSASGNTSVTTTISYSVPQTTLLTQTNSEGVVTGQPVAATIPAGLTASPVAATIPAGETGSPVAITSQPAVATIPAGLSIGVTSLAQNASGTLSYFTVSVGTSTTLVIGGAGPVVAVGTASSGTASGSAASASASASSAASGSGSASAASATGSSSTAAAAASSSTAKSAASVNGAQIASAGLIGLGALFAALL
ncbi:hypothetical protein LTR91_020752 [Friedmanniomyces endolithicus]|uniref:BIG2 domain-containing protein n=1 Tax=Friedmanniomyces endolithicus TaxID=329885 RepID=A0AAN6K061_9PEZI|nr:hypothetical protein LTR82_015964 [Friedmanniomyces endolithicus]KAK0915175.1 hypothetical protein LTR57_013558 [Friedmanniomyces endolithicus]KAK0959615.1 hypothetical protein LTR91_020752 [Friedmanniomyces endolithicus]KAK0991380.1 hypothetical protein LTR54_011747 [Friedmanniomyces endolithicus]KAK1043140.1 hypothetical protein LTS16_008200 [Friedmanniomyces endolithicus]